MKQSINNTQFHNAFRDAGREEQFSYESKNIMFDYIEQYEQESGEEWELDVIGLCCEISEMSEQEVKEAYTIDWDEYASVSGFLYENTSVCGEYEYEGQTVFVFQQF
jgi:hypothetical protein